MKNCVFVGNTCRVCGAPKINANQACGTYTAGLGDVIAAGLAAVGITKERVANAIGVDDCGCPKRQEQLNAFGWKWLGIGGDS